MLVWCQSHRDSDPFGINLVWCQSHRDSDPFGINLVVALVDPKPGHPFDFAERLQFPAKIFERHFPGGVPFRDSSRYLAEVEDCGILASKEWHGGEWNTG